VAARVWLYAVPTVPPGREVVVIAGASGAGLITMESALVPSPATLRALTVKLAVSATVGVPEITPVEELSNNPAGRFPLLIDHVIDVSPVAVRVWLYAVPTVPPGREAVVIVGGVPVVDGMTLKVAQPENTKPFEFVTRQQYKPLFSGMAFTTWYVLFVAPEM
jgi:hypothetical protein